MIEKSRFVKYISVFHRYVDCYVCDIDTKRILKDYIINERNIVITTLFVRGSCASNLK